MKTIQCKLNDWVDVVFEKNYLDIDEYDYDLFYENKKLENYKTFYEIIAEDKIENNPSKENINNTNHFVQTNDNLENSTTTVNKGNEKIFDKYLSVFPKNGTNVGKIEIEMKVIKKSCSIRYKRKITICCRKVLSCLVEILVFILGIIIYVIFAAFILAGGWIFVLVCYIISKCLE